MSSDTPGTEKSRTFTPTQFFLRGLAISLPPILTLVILIWIGGAVYDYFIRPTSIGVRFVIVQFIERSVPTNSLVRLDNRPQLDYCERNYLVTEELRVELNEALEESIPEQLPGRVENEVDSQSLVSRVQLQQAVASFIERRTDAFLKNRLEENIDPQIYVPLGEDAVPYEDYSEVVRRFGINEMETSATGVYMDLVTIRYFQSQIYLSAVAVAVAIIILYFLGRLVTVRLGAWAITRLETVFLGRLPVVSNVYSSVKQVTDFFFSERTIEYNRVVAVEYPRQGIWSIGFVTGDSMLEITAAAGEPLVSVLMPTSPMPMTGFTISVSRSEIIDLNLTIDQAFQFCLSCGVLVPPQQAVTPELLQQELAKRLAVSESAVRRNVEKPQTNIDPETPEASS